MSATEILARQKREIEEKMSLKIIEREAKATVEKFLDKDIIKVITGVRRSGKSTFAFLLLKGKKFGYVNFDEKELLNEKLDNILSAVKEVYGDVNYLFLDEIQNVDGWELWVNSLQRRGYNLIITGSNARLLSKELATHLTGRYLSFEIFPFSFREFLRFKEFSFEELKYSKEKEGEIKRLLREYLFKGGFPEYLVKELDESYLITLFNSIVYSDIVKRWNVKYFSMLEDLIRYLISIHANEYTATKLKNILNFRSTLTVQNYIKYAEEAYLIFSLERFSFKPKEFLKTPKKVYCVDFGLINAVSKRTTEDIGRLMENCVFLDLKRRGLKENGNLFYLKVNEKEVDFLIKEGLNIKQLIQVTYASSKDEIDQREIKSLEKAYELFKKDKPELIIITWDYEEVLRKNNLEIKCIPLWKWLLKI